MVVFPFQCTLETFRRLIPALDDVADRLQRAKREAWWRSETGGTDADFQPVEEFRR